MVSPAERMVRPFLSYHAKDRTAGERLQRAHEDRQPQDAINDRRHPGQIVDIGLDERLMRDCAIGIFFQVDRRANPDREGEQDGDHDQVQRAKQRRAHPCQFRLAAMVLVRNCAFSQERNSTVASG